VQLKIVNDASDPNQAVSNYQKLITGDRVDLVFGPFSSLLTGPSATVANRYKYAFLEPAGGGPRVGEAEPVGAQRVANRDLFVGDGHVGGRLDGDQGLERERISRVADLVARSPRGT